MLEGLIKIVFVSDVVKNTNIEKDMFNPVVVDITKIGEVKM